MSMKSNSLTIFFGTIKMTVAILPILCVTIPCGSSEKIIEISSGEQTPNLVYKYEGALYNQQVADSGAKADRDRLDVGKQEEINIAHRFGLQNLSFDSAPTGQKISICVIVFGAFLLVGSEVRNRRCETTIKWKIQLLAMLIIVLGIVGYSFF